MIQRSTLLSRAFVAFGNPSHGTIRVPSLQKSGPHRPSSSQLPSQLHWLGPRSADHLLTGRLRVPKRWISWTGRHINVMEKHTRKRKSLGVHSTCLCKLDSVLRVLLSGFNNLPQKQNCQAWSVSGCSLATTKLQTQERQCCFQHILPPSTQTAQRTFDTSSIRSSNLRAPAALSFHWSRSASSWWPVHQLSNVNNFF